MLHSSTLYLIEGQIELAEKIAALSPIPDAKVFFGTSGTDGTETALLLATSYRQSNQVLAMRNSYHGRGFGAMAVTGNRGYSPTSLLAVPGALRAERRPLPQPVRAPARRRVLGRLRRRPAPGHRHDDLRRRRLPDRRADPGRRRLHHAARRVLPRAQGRLRRVRHPVHRRRGADRLGPYRRALLGHRGARRHARPDDLRQGHRQRPVHRRRRRQAPTSWTRCRPRRSRPSAATRW